MKSDIESTWVSAGRKKQRSRISLGENVQDFIITDTHVFWCGADGLDIAGAANVKVVNSTFSSSPGIGIHNISGSRSYFSGNHCDAKVFSGNGSSTQQACIIEEPAATGNVYLNNDETGMRHANMFRGSGATVRP